jgi:hypothetical protein
MRNGAVFRDGKPFGLEDTPDFLMELCQLGNVNGLARVDAQPSSRSGDAGGFAEGEGVVRHDLVVGEELKMDFAKMAVPAGNLLPGQVQPMVGPSTFRLVDGYINGPRLSGVMTWILSSTKDQPRRVCHAFAAHTIASQCETGRAAKACHPPREPAAEPGSAR